MIRRNSRARVSWRHLRQWLRLIAAAACVQFSLAPRKKHRREHCRASFSGIHFWAAIFVRGRGRRAGPVARLHRSDSRRAHRADAVLRTHTGRSGRPVAPVADPRARPGLLRGASRVESSGYDQQSLRLWPGRSSRCPCPGHLRRRRRVPDGHSRDVSRTKSTSDTTRTKSTSDTS